MTPAPAATAPAPTYLFAEIYLFLQAYDLDPYYIPTINELGKRPGGFALVKRISEHGGLKRIRPGYQQWVTGRRKQHSTSLSLPTDQDLDELYAQLQGRRLHWRVFARAVLARWGQVPSRC